MKAIWIQYEHSVNYSTTPCKNVVVSRKVFIHRFLKPREFRVKIKFTSHQTPESLKFHSLGPQIYLACSHG